MKDPGERAQAAFGIPAPEFRMPPEVRPGAVRLQVSDLDRSLDYYRRVLTLRLLERADGRASLGAEDGSPPLVELHERPGAAPAPPGGRPGLYHYAILLPDRSALGRFVGHLDDIGQPAGASDHLVSEAVYLRDPDGLGIEVYADRPRSHWRHRGRELLMTTEPLDVAGVMSAAGGRAWSGMPPGTVIGHVHLHVGDLEEAQAFYHEALGLDKVVWSYPGALFLSAGGYHHHLGVNTWAREASPPGQDDARLLEWELLLPSEEDVRDALESVTAGGYRVERSESGGTVRDPWGTALRLRRRDGP